MKFNATISGSDFTLKDPLKWRRFVEMSDNGEYELTVKRATRQRSNRQLRYYWGVIVKMISDETGYTPEEVHELLLMNAFGYSERKIGDLISREPIKRSSDLSKPQFEILTRKSREFGSMILGIYIPEPNEVEY